MKRDKDKIRKKIEALINLPTLPGVVNNIIHTMGKDVTSAEDIGKMISVDQVLSAKVLRLVNSAFYGFPGRISSVTYAIVLLGFDVVKGMVLGASVFEIMMAQGMIDLWRHSLGCAMTAGIIARKIKQPEPEVVTCAGLLHDLGKVVLKVELPKISEKINKKVQKEKISVYQAEDEVLGFTHATIGLWLCERWNLSKDLSDPVSYHHKPSLAKHAYRQTAIIHLADILVKAKGYGSGGDSLVPMIDKKAWKSLKIKPKLLEEIINDMTEALDNADDSVFL
ncbi:MAG: HDOD domain-containing protein [Proteobacteria bacterium]|nr:HDOD domain-containing protein [Pseudomonadota bacterium]